MIGFRRMKLGSRRSSWCRLYLLHCPYGIDPARKSFFDHRLLKNGNYVTGVMFIFIVGVVLFATRALLPTMLENSAGLSGCHDWSGNGTERARFHAGDAHRRTHRRPCRSAPQLVGRLFNQCRMALWQMTIIRSTCRRATSFGQASAGFRSAVRFRAPERGDLRLLEPEMRAQGTAIFSLVRNIGSSIGISVAQTLLIRSTVTAHAGLAERITYANPAWTNPAVASAYDFANRAALQPLTAR